MWNPLDYRDPEMIQASTTAAQAFSSSWSEQRVKNSFFEMAHTGCEAIPL
jgi:hypothetical protein